MLMELIINAQNKDENAMLRLISRFNLLLKKYARKLNQEDAYADMVTYFIELIHSINTPLYKFLKEMPYETL